VQTFRETAYRYAENKDRVSAPTVIGGVQPSSVGEVSMSTEGVVKIRVGDGVAMKPKVVIPSSDQNSTAGLVPFTKIRTRDTIRLIRVTIVIRQHSRRILNLVAVQQVLRASEVVDPEWSTTGTVENQRGGGKVVVMDTMSLQEQVNENRKTHHLICYFIYISQILLMRDTDLLIGVHGSAFTNAALFMRPHSVCIALMQSRHIEFILSQVGGYCCHLFFMLHF
jgi:hypothetical protein